MASKGTIGGRIVLEGESEYRAALRNITQEQKELRSEMKLCSSEFKESQNSLEALTKIHEVLEKQIDSQKKKVELYANQLQKAKDTEADYAKKVEELKEKLASAENEFKDMKDSTEVSSETLENQKKVIDELKEKLTVAEQGYEKSGQVISQFQVNLNNANADLNAMSTELQNTDKYMKEAEQSADSCATSIDEFGHRTKEAGEQSRKFGEKSENAINNLSDALVATGIVQGVEKVKDALMECVAASQQFETATAKLSTIADTNAVSMGELKDQIISASTELGVAASDISDVSYDAISASVDTAKAVGVTSDAAKLATAGFTDTSSALSVLTTAMNAYNISADELSGISDSLIQTQNLGVLTINSLASSMGKAIATASAYSIDIYNLESGYIALTKSGISAEESTTYMASMFSELGDAGSDVAGIITEKTGKSFGELMQSGYNLGQVLNILSESVDGNAEAMMNLWGSQEAGKAANAIVNRGLKEFEQNLDSVKNSTGATQKAFDKMADTSEFASKKMKVSMQNLKIAIGDELQPEMERLYSAGTDVTEWAIDFVKENPEVVDAIAALSVGIGTFATGLAVAKVGMIGFNAVMNANPIVLCTTAVIGLTVAMTALLDHQNEYVENTKAAVEEQQKNIDSLHEEIEARKASNSETEATVATISSLKSQLIDLNGKEKLSNQDKAEMVSIVAQLNELLPDMNLSINEQTGYLEQNNSELEDLIENQTEYLELQAAQEEQAEIIKQITKAKINLNKATSEQAELESDLAEKQAEYNQGMIDGTIPAYGDLYQEINEAQKAVAEYDDQITESQAILDDLQGDYEVATDMINQYKESMNQASDAVNSTNANTIEYGSKTYEVSEEVKASFDEINAAYRIASSEALSSISSQVSLFDELSSKSDLTAQQMAENLQSQTDTFNQYSEDLKTASQMMKEDTTGSFSTIVQSIMDMGVEGAGYLHELVTAAEDSTESFDEVMNSFAEMEEARQTLADTMGDINVGYSDAVDQMIASTSDGLDSISNAFVDKSPEMRVSSAYMCDQIYDQMKTSIGMTDDGSSIVFQGTGNSIAKGVADGITAGQPTINTALQRAIDNAVANANFSGISARIDRILGDQLK